MTVAIDPGAEIGTPVDWWVAVMSPLGLYWLTLDRGWVRSDAALRTYGGPLVALTPYELLHTAELPVGSYAFYFGVDPLMNGVVDLDRLVMDSVAVTIQ